MISPSEAHRLILRNAKLFPIEAIPLQKAVGRVLRENIISDRDQPPFNKSLMDGIAIRFSSWQKGARVFPIQTIIPPGIKPPILKNHLNAVRIMTGAALPEGYDCVLPVETIDFKDPGARPGYAAYPESGKRR